MSSSKQIRANKMNATLSTGPKSETGKAIVSKNAIKHGVLSSDSVMPWENASDLLSLQEALYQSLKPVGAIETILFERIVSLIWRLKRIGKIEVAISIWKKHSDAMNAAIEESKAYVEFRRPFEIEDMFPPEKVILDNERYNIAIAKIKEHSETLSLEFSTVGRQFAEQTDTFAKLQRYETGIENSLFKFLHELERLQHARKTGNVTPPIAVDIQFNSKAD